MSRRVVVAGTIALAVVVGATTWVVAHGGSHDDRPRTAPRPTVVVERGTVRQEQRLTGRVGHGAPRTITGAGDGIVTWLPGAGDRIDRGEQVYRVDDQPVALFHGTLPLYR